MTAIVTTPALGYYLWPIRWVGAAPAWVPAFHGPSAEAKLDDVIVEVTLPDGLRSRAYRDGMLAYDFSAEHNPEALFADNIATYARRLQIINAHLACLKASLTHHVQIAPATSENAVGFSWEQDDGYALTGGVAGTGGETGIMMISLARARVEQPLGPLDWRFIRMGAVVSEDQVARSYGLLRRLLEIGGDHRGDVLLQAELLLRADGALSVQDNAGALVYAWTAAEALLQDMFSRWAEDRASEQDAGHDEQGNERVFLDARRRKELEGRDMTAWHMAEIGSLAGWLPYELYRTLRDCTSARNRWLHKRDLDALRHAPKAILAAQELFRLAEGIDLRPHHLGSNDG